MSQAGHTTTLGSPAPDPETVAGYTTMSDKGCRSVLPVTTGMTLAGIDVEPELIHNPVILKLAPRFEEDESFRCPLSLKRSRRLRPGGFAQIAGKSSALYFYCWSSLLRSLHGYGRWRWCAPPGVSPCGAEAFTATTRRLALTAFTTTREAKVRPWYSSTDWEPSRSTGYRRCSTCTTSSTCTPSICWATAKARSPTLLIPSSSSRRCCGSSSPPRTSSRPTWSESPWADGSR